LYVPVLFLPLFSFNDSAFIAFPLTGFTTKWYAQLFADSAVRQALANSLKVGAAAALISTMLGIPAAKALTRYRVPGGGAVLAFVNIPLFVPEIVLGISLLILLNTAGIPLSLMTVVLGHIVFCVPFAITVLMSRMDGFDTSLEEASLSSLLLTFMVSFDDFLVAYFLAGTDTTLPIYIWGSLRFPAQLPKVLALGAMILVVSTVLVVVAEWIRSLGVEEGRRPMVGA
jgi:spermidine/putrescine transport system permease protein